MLVSETLPAPRSRRRKERAAKRKRVYTAAERGRCELRHRTVPEGLGEPYLIEPQEAWARLVSHVAPLAPERVERRVAVGRVLTEPLTATVDVPAHDVSAMDGYALDGAVEAGERRVVAGTVAAGDPPGFELPAGQAARIMTGAPVPRGADRVVPVEQTDGGEERALFRSGVAAGAHIRRGGEILRVGREILSPGALLTPGALGLVATHGYVEVPVLRSPRVATLATGDEIVPPEIDPRPGQLRDSHTDFLLGAGRGLGLEFESLGIVPDRPHELEEKIRRGLEADVLLMTGGVSKGEYDFVKQILDRLGCRQLFDAVAIQPGKPFVVARHPRGLVFGLPGNPASVMVCFWLFVRPALRSLMGLADGYWHGALAGELVAPLPGAKGRARFLSADVAFRDGRILVRPFPPVGSHDLVAYGRGTALVRVPAHAEPAQPGETCEILPLVDWPTATSSPGATLSRSLPAP
ncbi:MAG: gephyrin-like molybdotransferase Glp [Thermoanaerobaculia bacterium]